MPSVMEAFNASTTAFPDSVHATIASANASVLSKVLDNVNFFGVVLTLLALAVAYDQSMLPLSSSMPCVGANTARHSFVLEK